jgi:hypothetical protein
MPQAGDATLAVTTPNRPRDTRSTAETRAVKLAWERK